jgi:nitrite reductase (NADH) small subunit
MGEFVKAAETNEIAPGQARLVVVKGKEIALFNVDGTYFALANACTHEEGPLAEREVEGHEVTCPWHGAKFDIRRARSSVTRPMKPWRASMCGSRVPTSRLRFSAG